MQGPTGYQLSEFAARATQLVNDIEEKVPFGLEEFQQLRQAIEVMDVEIASRIGAMQTMNTILGYDNSDGKHSTPSPEDLAKAAVEDAWKYRQLSK